MKFTKVYFLHGFSGDPEDWDEVISYLPGWPCQALTYPFQLPSEGILIGYSMGGRIALQTSLPKIVISAHPGLQTPEEKEARALKVEAWIQKLKTVSLSQFFDEWYAQPLFAIFRKHPHFPRTLERRLKQDPRILIEQLEKHPLSAHTSNGFFMHGALDPTYRDLYRKWNIPSVEIPDAGHACHLENPLDTARQIQILIGNLINR